MMNFAGEKFNLTPEELLNLVTGGKGGKAVFKNAIDNPLDTLLGGEGGTTMVQSAINNPLDTLLGGEGGTEEFQNIDWKSLLTGGKILE